MNTKYDLRSIDPTVRAALLEVLADPPQTLEDRLHASADRVTVCWKAGFHHSGELAALMVETALDPAKSMRQHQQRRTTTLTCMMGMDDPEKRTLAALAAYPLPGYEARRADFNDALRQLISLPEIQPYFQVTHTDSGSHYSVRPTGYDEDELALIKDKAALRSLDLRYRSLIAVIMVAYNYHEARRVFTGRGLALKAGEAAEALLALPFDFRRLALILMASYSGW